MYQEIIIYMVVRNVSKRFELFTKVINQASKISKNFFIVNHWSDDNTIDLINSLLINLKLNLNLINEEFIWTMDDMKWKYYNVLKESYSNQRKFIFILDYDEVLDDKLIEEIKSLDFKKDIYMINRHTYLIKYPIDKNSFLPLLFEINSVEIAPFYIFHKLYKIKSKNIKKLKWILHHYSYETMDDLFNKNKFYAKWEAQVLFNKNKNINNYIIFVRFLFEWTLYFLYTLFYHFNFLHLEWWFYSINLITYKVYKYLFYIELKNGKQKKYTWNL